MRGGLPWTQLAIGDFVRQGSESCPHQSCPIRRYPNRRFSVQTQADPKPPVYVQFPVSRVIGQLFLPQPGSTPHSEGRKKNAAVWYEQGQFF
jgi:hypothetical protein